MDRRQFLAVAAGSGALGATMTANANVSQETAHKAFALDSPPVLQNPTADGVTIAWAVNAPSTGWVEYGPTAELGQRLQTTVSGLAAYEDRFHSVRLTKLRPGQTIHYRVVSAPVTFHGPYQIERGEPVASAVYRFTPAALDAERATFAVINDTHEKTPTIAALMELLAQEPADFTVWNGDVFDDVNGDEQIVECALRPANAPYATEHPVLFVPGNHDHRGALARGLARAFTPWPDEPNASRCFAVRHGPLAMIGLDTGEDKPDHHPAWAGLAAFEPYHVAQRDWLANVLKRPDIAAAPHLVVFCHIPLWGLPGENGGDTLEGYGSFNRHAKELWHPLLADAGVQLVISGHTHRHRYDAPTPDRPYGQLIGGGPQLDRATLIRANANAQTLDVTAANVDGTILGRWQFAAGQ